MNTEISDGNLTVEAISMLDELQMAIRHYEQIAPSPGNEMSQSQADQLSNWLERQVASIVGSLLSRPGFRHRARWPIDCLTGEKDCPERDAVLAVDQALVTCAKSLSRFARLEPIWNQLMRLGPYQNEVPEAAPSAFDSPCGDESQPPTPLGLRQVEFVASRPWRDLASTEDYFCPTAQFNYNERDGEQYGEFLPFLNAQLRVPGDFITRCMEIRIRRWQEALQQFFVRCIEAHRKADCDISKQRNDLSDRFSELKTRIDALHHCTREGQEAGQRDSCIALLQIYAGYHQDVDFSWMGPVAELVSGISDIPYRVKSRHEWEVPERAAAALIDIADLVRNAPSPDDLIEEMKTTKRLVLIEERREAFLDGRSINRDDRVNWHGRGTLVWEMLWTLAEQAQLGRNVDTHCLSNPQATESEVPLTSQAIKDRRADLKKQIMPTLNDLIVSAGRSTYRLNLGADEICLLGWFSEERLDVLPPSPPRHASRRSVDGYREPVRLHLQ